MSFSVINFSVKYDNIVEVIQGDYKITCFCLSNGENLTLHKNRQHEFFPKMTNIG